MNMTTEHVAQRFEECVWVFDQLPSALRLDFVNAWPEITCTPQEIRRQTPDPIRLRPLPDAIDRAEETLRWIQCVTQDRRRLIWLRAQHYSWREIARRTGLPKSSAHRYWHQGLTTIIHYLQPSLTHVD